MDDAALSNGWFPPAVMRCFHQHVTEQEVVARPPRLGGCLLGAARLRVAKFLGLERVQVGRPGRRSRMSGAPG